MNSVINLFIYFLFCEKYCYEFRRIFCFYFLRRGKNCVKFGLMVMIGLLKFNGDICKFDVIIVKYKENGCFFRNIRIIYIILI